MGEMGEMGEIRDRQPATVWGGNMTRQGAYVYAQWRFVSYLLHRGSVWDSVNARCNVLRCFDVRMLIYAYSIRIMHARCRARPLQLRSGEPYCGQDVADIAAYV